jgi:hypothetical protein
VNGEKIVGIAWSDDVITLVHEHLLKKVLLVISSASKTYKKKLKASKSWAIPMCRKENNQERPTIQLDGKDIPTPHSEKILGFMLSSSVQGTRIYARQLRSKVKAAIAKLESVGIHNGHLVRPLQTEKYYNSTVQAVIKSNLAQYQLDTPDGATFGYELARKMTARVLRRMLGTSNRTSPIVLILETGWDLPDKSIIKEKLTFHTRMAQRTHEEDKKQRLREKNPLERKDSPSHVWRGRLAQVEQGETKGICAEAKRLWHEAGMGDKWPPPVSNRVRSRMKKHILRAAERINESRLLHELELRSKKDGDTPYNELYDGTTWRLTNGDKRKIGLMTTARAGALMTNAGRAADGDKLDPTCICCQKEHDTARHVLLECEALTPPRNELWELAMDIWDEAQQDEFAGKTDQQQYMTLLGKQMKNTLDLDQQMELDLAVKLTLTRMDDIRQKTYNLQPLNGRINNQPPERSIQLTEQWRQEQEHSAALRAQGSPLGDGYSSSDSD